MARSAAGVRGQCAGGASEKVSAEEDRGANVAELRRCGGGDVGRPEGLCSLGNSDTGSGSDEQQRAEDP